MSSLICPKCGSDMRSYERNRLLVDQCTGCGGLFLDRGELEQLVAAENAWHTSSAPAPQQQQQYAQSPQQSYGGQQYDRQHEGYPRRPKKKKSFLSELFDD